MPEVVLFVRSNNLITTETIVLTHAEDRFRVVSAETVTSGFLNRPYPPERKVSARWRRAANTTRTNDRRRRRRRENPISARTTRATVSGGGLGWSGRGRRQILHGTTQDEDRAGRTHWRPGTELTTAWAATRGRNATLVSISLGRPRGRMRCHC